MNTRNTQQLVIRACDKVAQRLAKERYLTVGQLLADSLPGELARMRIRREVRPWFPAWPIVLVDEAIDSLIGVVPAREPSMPQAPQEPPLWKRALEQRKRRLVKPQHQTAA